MLHIDRATDLLVAVCTYKKLADYRLHSANDILASDDALTSGSAGLIGETALALGAAHFQLAHRRFALMIKRK
jgi:hypothetical protein